MRLRPAHRPSVLALLLLVAPALALGAGQTPPPPSDPPLVDVEDAPAPEGAPGPEAAASGAAAAAPKLTKLERHPGTLIAPGEQPTVLARAELIGVQGLNGLTQGVLLCAALQCLSSQQLTMGSALLGAAIGVGLSAWVTADGISGGPAQVINSGASWGLFDGLMLAIMTAEIGDPVWKPTLTVSLTGLAGTGLGAFVAYQFQPVGGDLAMVNSGGLWAALLTSLFLTPVYAHITADALAGLNLMASTAGLVAMGLVSRAYGISRGRMFLIDAGGMLGMLLGFTAAAFAGYTGPTSSASGPIAAVGAIAGLTAAFVITSDLDETTGIEVALVPLLGGGRADAKGAALLVAF